MMQITLPLRFIANRLKSRQSQWKKSQQSQNIQVYKLI